MAPVEVSQRNSNAGADSNGNPSIAKGSLRSLQIRACQICRLPVLGYQRLDDGELIAAQPGHLVDVSQMRAQSFSNRREQLVAEWVSPRVIDKFEAVEIDQMQSEL